MGGSAQPDDIQVRDGTVTLPQDGSADLGVALPPWIQAGFAVRIVTLGVIIIGAVSFLPWRQSVEVPLILITRSPPRSVITNEPGVLASIAVPEGAIVRTGETLARVGTIDEIAEVDRLAAYCEGTLSALQQHRSPAPLPGLDLGGALQAAHASTAAALTDLRLKLEFSDHRSKLAAAQHELSSLSQRQAGIRKEIALASSLVGIAERQLNIKSEVAAQGWISEAVLAQTRADLLRQRMLAIDKTQELERLRAQAEQTRSSLTSLELAHAQEKAQLHKSAQQAIARLAGEIESWRRGTAIVAPVPGRLRYTTDWAIGQPLPKGAEFAVVTPVATEAIAVGTVPSWAKAAVVPGAEVKLAIPSHPAFRFGWVVGRVESVSSVATSDGYRIRVGLPNGLLTTYGRRLPLRQRTAVSGVIRLRQGRLVDYVVGSARSHLEQSER